jgi:hypothetical protein
MEENGTAGGGEGSPLTKRDQKHIRTVRPAMYMHEHTSTPVVSQAQHVNSPRSCRYPLSSTQLAVSKFVMLPRHQ